MAQLDALRCSSPADYIQIARRLRKSGTDCWMRLAVLASHSIQFLDAYLVVASNRARFPVDPWFAPFGQIEEQVLPAISEFWRMQPGAIWISLRLEDVERWLPDEYYAVGPDGAEQKIRALRDRLVRVVREIRMRSASTILVSNFASPRLDSLDPFSASQPRSLKHIIGAANRELAEALTSFNDAWVFDYAGAVSARGSEEWSDACMDYVARVGIAPKNMSALANRFVRCFAATQRPAAKCVVVDLDNTLWGGEIGDDGLEGIHLGQDYPGSAYRDVQMFLKGLRSRGVLLAVSSKNEANVAISAIDTHPDMVLRTRDFANLQINRDPKPDNLVRIARELNIGLESLVFIDDNPVERAQVRIELPMVCVPDMPIDIGEWLRTLEQLETFDRPGMTAEDRQRADMYTANQERRNLERSATDLDGFLSSLEMVAWVGLCDDQNFNRIHQLIQKTNQFNLTGRRFSSEEIRSLAGSAGSAVAWLRLKDRYGDQGLVCVGIVRDTGGGIWNIDCLLMSCRVIGRRVEDAFLMYLREIVAGRGGCQLRGKYVVTGKNTLVANLYREHGFLPETLGGNGSGEIGSYLRSVNDEGWAWPLAIKRE